MAQATFKYNNKINGVSLIQENSFIVKIILFLLFIVFYHSAVWELIQAWLTNHYYNHGFLIPLISLYIIFFNRKKLSKLEIRPSFYGLIIITLSLIVCAISLKVYPSLFLSSISMICFFLGVILFIYGKEYFSVLTFPILYLIFMVPMPTPLFELIIYPLQLIASYIGNFFFQLFGVPVFREGIILHFAPFGVTVARSCSAMHSLIALSAISCIVAYFFSDSWGKRVIIVATSFPLAILFNGFRLVFIILLAMRFGQWVFDSFLHPLSGKMFFLMALAVLVLESVVLNKVWQRFKFSETSEKGGKGEKG